MASTKTHLRAQANRDQLVAHDPDMMTTVVKTVGSATYEDWFVTQERKAKRLEEISQDPNLSTMTIPAIALDLFGSDDEAYCHEVRLSLKYGSKFNDGLVDGTSITARKDDTLRITGTPEEYGDLTEENVALKIAREKKSTGNNLRAIGRMLDKATEKVPSEQQRFESTKVESKDHLSSFFSRQLALLAGGDE